jgi:hypothetical protein
LILTGPQAEEGVIPEAVAMETTTFEVTTTELAVKQMMTTAPEPGEETQVNPQPGSITEVVVREAVVGYAAPLRLAPMSESGTSSR